MAAQFHAAHARHPDIADNQVDGRACPTVVPAAAIQPEARHGLLPVGCGHHREVAPELVGKIPAHVGIVVYHKHRLVVHRRHLQLGHRLHKSLAGVCRARGHPVGRHEIAFGVGFSRHWQAHGKHAPAPGIVVEAYHSVVGCHEPGHQIEPNAEAAAALVARAVSVEYAGPLVGRHPYASVGHHHHHASAIVAQPQVDAAAGRGILDGVVEQFIHYLVEKPAVYKHLPSLALWGEAQRHAIALGHVVKRVGNAAKEAHHPCQLERQVQPVFLHASEFKQLVDEPQHAVDTALHPVDGHAQVAYAAAHLPYALHAAGYQGERCAELVGDVGEKVELKLRQALLYGYVAPQAVDGMKVSVGHHGCQKQHHAVDGESRRRGPPRR